MMISLFGFCKTAGKTRITFSTKSLAKALATFWIEKGFGSQFLDLPKLRFLDHPVTLRPRTTFSVATPSRFAGLLTGCGTPMPSYRQSRKRFEPGTRRVGAPSSSDLIAIKLEALCAERQVLETHGRHSSTLWDYQPSARTARNAGAVG